MALSNLNTAELTSVSSVLSRPADEFGNDTNMEVGWAMKAFHHAETHFNLISAVDPTLLRLSPKDDEIYTTFREHFKDLDVGVLNEDEMKSPEGKAKWRAFCNTFEGQLEDFNMGTLMRLDASQDVNEKNTTLVPRVQFLAVEVARNREGHNSNLRKVYGKKKPEIASS